MYCTCRCRESRQSAKLLLIELLPPYLDLVKEEFGAFDPYKLDRIWAIMYDNLRSILKNRGGNDYKPEHTGKRKRQKSAGTAVDLTVPMEDYHECVRLVREYRRAHPLE